MPISSSADTVESLISDFMAHLKISPAHATRHHLSVHVLYEFILDNLPDSCPDVDQLAARCYLSSRQFTRELKKYTGLTPAKFCREIRLHFACHLLKNFDHSIAEVAYQCGFTYHSTFSEVFKRRFGITPWEWNTVSLE